MRVDRIGFVGELAKSYVEDNIKPKVKGGMTSAEVLEGDYFEAVLIEPQAGVVSTADPAELVRLYDCGTINRQQLLSCLSADASKVGGLGLTLKQQAKIVTKWPGSTPTPRLNVTLKRGTSLTLARCVVGLAEAFTSEISAEAGSANVLAKAA